MMRRIGHWVRDYFYAGHRIVHAFIYRTPPQHYLGYVRVGKAPVIIIPGIYEKWNYLKPLADVISRKGHPVYVVPRLAHNTRAIPASADIVRKLISEKDLKNVVLLAHSKGGIIGKYLLAFLNSDHRVRRLIAIASPFGGSFLAHIPLKGLGELRPGSEVLTRLDGRKDVNRDITSLFGAFDNHIWPASSCRLEGAENIQVDAHGHHAILASPKTSEIVLRTIERISP
ncbi:MAG: hypothetical protein RL681_441 [Candidatus Parcubacteria bacterium]|jgi:pimeloyl-ACP methyl ester carboxylesterase